MTQPFSARYLLMCIIVDKSSQYLMIQSAAKIIFVLGEVHMPEAEYYVIILCMVLWV